MTCVACACMQLLSAFQRPSADSGELQGVFQQGLISAKTLKTGVSVITSKATNRGKDNFAQTFDPPVRRVAS